MNQSFPYIKSFIIASSLALAACGGGSSSSTATPTPTASTTLSGTAAAGAALIGTVTVKGSLGVTKSAIIEANGNYNVDVTGLTAPYRLRASGTVGGKTYKLHSYAEAADVGGNVNITPFTDLIVANAAQQIAESFFDSTTTTSLDSAVVDAQEDALQAKLQTVLTALGVDSAINLLNSTFSADHSGLDAALDIVRVEVDTSTNIATLTNLIENTTITDNVLDDSDNTEVLTADTTVLTGAVSDTQAIVNLFTSLGNAFDAGLPTTTAIQDLLSDDFLQGDQSKGLFLTDITTDPSVIGLGFTGVSVSNLESTLGTATVTFNVEFQGVVDPEPETWLVAKNGADWQLRGDQRIAEVDQLSFHCNDNNGEDTNPAGCGINTAFFDDDFTNNGTNNDAIASGTVVIKDGTGNTVKETIYLGNPPNNAPGEIFIYNASSNVSTDGFFSGDFRGFGTALNEIDPAIFAVGDIIEYNLYVDALNVTDPTAPSVNVGNPTATYSNTLLFTPSTTPLVPSATAATLTAMENFTLGNDLTISWTLQDGTISDEVLVQISDNQGNRIEVWDESFAASATSTTFASASLDATAAEPAGLDAEATSYNLLVRVYASDPVTGQFHSTDYTRTIDGPAAGGGTTTPPVSNLTCSYQSGWDDAANGGFGAPINPNSFADYETVVTACGTAQAFTVVDVAGDTYLSDGESVSFNNSTGAGTEGDPKTGVFTDTVDNFTFNFEWYVEAASCSGCTHSYLVLFSDTSIDQNLPIASLRETTALIGIDGNNYSYVKYSEQPNFGDMVRATGADGEIWNSVDVLQP